MENQIQTLPCIPLKGIVLLPEMIVQVDVSRHKSKGAVADALLSDERLFVVKQRDDEVNEPEKEDLYDIGMIVRVRQAVRAPGDVTRVQVESVARAQLQQFYTMDDHYEAVVFELEEPNIKELDSNQEIAMYRTLSELFSVYAQHGNVISRDMRKEILGTTDLFHMANQIAANLPMEDEKKQELLEALNFQDKYVLLTALLSNEIEISRIREELRQDLKQRIDKNQREYILREQMKLIREELGENNFESEVDSFQEKAEKLKASEEVKNTILHEIERLRNTAGNQAESGVIRGYIETLLAMPWDKVSRDRRDLKTARKTLEAEHYGLSKVKERILEYLAVRTLTKKGDAPILCLVGPPGTGKTSIARSVAKALNKKFVRMSLGGVRDEAEIRGHRRTYIGAMSGRIATSLRQAGVKNPLILLDEIDKTSGDFRGSISSALLEVLDPEENDRFADHYIELPIDLSEVLFIATANDVQEIPQPLLDRMELIEISSYTENEKLHIAREHLIQKQMKVNGIRKNQLTIDDDAISEIISRHTREAGVRSLERKIGEICRKTALRIQEKGEKQVHVTAENLEEFLGRGRFSVNPANEKPEIGIVRGLAWTSVGGTTLQVEVNIMPGKGSCRLTGQLGNVMKESAETGVSYIRSIAPKYGFQADFFEKNDIHVHIPEGAVPKDGPSAGITMATAIFSAITGTPVRADLAMTGEITLRGRVLPIGGLKEKLLAAKKANLAAVLVPKKNEPDVREFDSEITDGLAITYVSSMTEVLKEALVREPELSAPGKEDRTD
jgi:ATP-dependent Lon protease